MNKLLAKVLLVCLMLTCISSGTLAVYTTTIDDVMQTSVRAKRFFIGLNAVDNFNVRLAPGEVQYTEFAITNVDSNGNPTEVDMDLTIVADYSSLYSTLTGVKVYMEELIGGSFIRRGETNSEGVFRYDQSKAFIAEQSAERSFRMVFEWADEDYTPIDLAGKSVDGLTMYITGTQHVD